MNLKVTVKDLNTCEKVLTIDVAHEEVTAEYDAFFEAVGRRAKIPGFRPGHAPKNVVERHFREQAREEVLHNLISKSFREVVREKELLPITHPTVDQVEFDENHLKFNAHVELRPTVKIEKYAGLSLKREIAPVEEKEVGETVERIRESHAKYQPVEDRQAQMGDYLVSDYRLEVDGKEAEKRSNEWFQIREKDFLEGFSKQLIGAKGGENREVVVKFPANFAKKEWAGKEGHFHVTVKEIKNKMLPELNDDLAREAGNCQTLAEFEKSIRDDLEKHKRDESEVKLEKSLFDELIRQSKFEVPSGMVERRLQAIMEDRANQMLSYGVKEDEVKAQLEKSKDELRKDAERQVRLSFILDEIAVREKVEVQDSDIEKKFSLMAERFRHSADEVSKFYREKEERMESLRAQILNEKVIQLVKDKAQIQDVILPKERAK